MPWHIVEALEREASVEEALAAYSEQRCRFGASIVQHARHLARICRRN
jgi:hypothetical protein